MANWFSKAIRRIGETLGLVSRETIVDPTDITPLAGGEISGKRKPKRRSLRKWPTKRAEIWETLEEQLDSYLPEKSIDAYESKRIRLKEHYDMWSDPTQSKPIKEQAFEEFWGDMSEIGFDIADFDWSKFREAYPDAN